MTAYEARQRAAAENREWAKAVLTEEGLAEFLSRHGRPAPAEPDPEWAGIADQGVGQPPPGGARTVPPPSGHAVAVSFADFVRQAEEAGEQEWLADKLVPKGGLTVLGGDPKTGKTLLALELGFAVASGREFLGRDVSPAAFLYVTEEGTQFEIAKRAKRLLAHGEPELPTLVLWREGVRFDEPRTWQLVRDTLAELDRPTLLVLDPLRDLLAGDENDSASIAAVGRAIQGLLRDFPELTIVLIHHLSKRREGSGGFRLRGSSALWGKVDCTILLRADPPPDDADGEVPLRGRLETEPRNDARAVVRWEWDPETGLFRESDNAGTLADRAQDWLTTNGPATIAQLTAALGTTADTVRRTLNRHRDRFSAQPTEPGQPSVWAVARPDLVAAAEEVWAGEFVPAEGAEDVL